MEAVTTAVSALEDNPVFNAGTGATLNLYGEAELDAAVIYSDKLSYGAVGALKRVKNPVLVARAVMELTGHSLICGEGALIFARESGFPDYDPVTSERLAYYQSKLVSEGGLAAINTSCTARADPKGTVGAVALDEQGRLAAATSTGGVSFKLPGRIGDSPICGAGTYASPWAAASATGYGEAILKMLTAKYLCDLVEAGQIAQAAAEDALRKLSELTDDAGIIAVDWRGNVGICHRTESMPFGVVTSSGSLKIGMNWKERAHNISS